jgi:hypothetical protein
MGVLREPKSWAKPRPANHAPRSNDLSPEECANVKRALRFLAVRLGGWAKLAEVTGAKAESLKKAAVPRHGVSAGLALRAARAASVPLEDVLCGAWPVKGACPHCGR